MSSRAKSLFIICATVVSLIAILYVASSTVMMTGFVKVEANDTRQHVNRAEDALFEGIAQLDRSAHDYASWDDTYAFIANGNEEYIQANLVDDTFKNLQINLLVLVDRSGRTVFGKAFDLENEQPIPLPLNIQDELVVGSPLLIQDEQQSTMGILLLPAGPLLIAAHPILTSQNEGPVRGTLIMGRFLDANEVKHLADVTHLSLTVLSYNEPEMPSDFQRARSSLSDAEPILIQPLSEETVAGYAVLNDIHKQPALLFKVEQPRTIYAQGQDSMGSFFRIMVLIITGFGVSAYLLVDRLVMSRLAYRDSEERYRAVIEQASEGILLVDAVTKRILEANPATQNLLGYTASELSGLYLYAVVAQSRESIDLNAQRLLDKKQLSLGERKYRRKDGSLVDVEVSLSLITYSGRQAECVVIHDITERKRAEQLIKHQVERLSALHTIDLAITGNRELKMTLEIFIAQVLSQLRVDAADVLLFNSKTGVLEFGASRGFRSEALRYTKLRPGEGLAGRAVIERHIINVPDLTRFQNGLKRSFLLAEEKFVVYYAVPLIANGEVKGVLEIFHRTTLAPDSDWLEFAEALGTQAAIAIEGAELFTNLKQTNYELTRAYDATIEGWSRALELRDQETEGHTLRVTAMTLQLARAMGIPEEELVHIRRGALLHDVGKIGIPDRILLKPGPLSPDEWLVMRQHPAYAYEMLLPITYLKPSLDIPYCHHEHWDGKGYPRGLVGSEIPLAARIFAIVDVWDALRSDRPYRRGWTEEQVLDYIEKQSGTQFDPAVVRVFLKLHRAPLPREGSSLSPVEV